MYLSNLNYYSISAIFLYGVVVFLFSSFQKEIFVQTQWQLEGISIKNKIMKDIDPCISGSEKSIWVFQEDGFYQSEQNSKKQSTGTWEIKGRSLHLKEQGAIFSFWISRLSGESLVLKARTAEGCMRIHFLPVSSRGQ